MNLIALKMLVGDRAKYLGIIMGLTFASLLITQQAGIFYGLMSRTYGAIEDLGGPDVWVMDQSVQFIDDVKPLKDTQVSRIRGIPGVEWAVPLYKGLIKARLTDGTFQTCIVMGLDDATLIGGPPTMVKGSLSDLWQADTVIVDEFGAKDKLYHTGPDGRRIPLNVGDTVELNDHRARVVGICKNTRTFQSQPVVYTTYTRALTFAPSERKMLSFVLVKAKPGVAPAALCRDIEAGQTNLSAYTQQGFENLTYNYYFKYTGIPINFGIAVGLGFLVGTAIAGQTFYNFTLDNLRHFGALKAMGASNVQLLKMILMQALLVGAIGYGLGVGIASGMGWVLRNTELSFKLPGWLLFASAAAVLMICAVSSLVSILKVIRLEPAVVFKS
ncbi:MAG TPA: ABC transporter permease [Tepidisphaeraceae bacterium]|jgi:putative ABC transport system permease protein|nr:ABC transporter permease [Tepidisphaeraceae bacterium]